MGKRRLLVFAAVGSLAALGLLAACSGDASGPQTGADGGNAAQPDSGSSSSNPGQDFDSAAGRTVGPDVMVDVCGKNCKPM